MLLLLSTNCTKHRVLSQLYSIATLRCSQHSSLNAQATVSTLMLTARLSRVGSVGGIASELRKHPKQWVKVLVLVDPWPRLLPGMPPLAPLAMGPSVGHMGSSTVRIRTFVNNHVR